MQRESILREEDLRHGYFEDITGYAHRSALVHLDNVKSWFYLTDDNIQIGRLAIAVLTGEGEFIKDLVLNGKLLVTHSIRNIPGDDFLCMDFLESYLLKPFKA